MTQEKRLHAILSPSGAKAWMTCARKPLMEKGLPDDANEYSDEGTCAHAVAALALTENEPVAEYVGRRFEVRRATADAAGRTYTFRDDMVEPVQVYVDLVRDYHRSLPGSQLFVEVEVPIGQITGEEGATGTADAVVLGLDEIIVIDLKFGMGVEVDVKENPQEMMYGLGAIAKFDTLNTIERARLVISQPRITPKPSEWDCTIERLREFEGEASAKAAFALDIYNGKVYEDGRLGLVASEDACRFCKAKASCPALAEFVVDTLGIGFEVLAAPITEEEIVAHVPTDLQDLGRKFRAIPLLELFSKAIRAKAEGTLFEMNNSPEAIAALGIKIVMGKQGNRAWSDKDAAEAMMRKFRLKQEEMYDFSLLSPTAIEKLLKSKSERAKGTWWPKLETLVSRAPGKPSVAPADDKRPPLEIKPSSEGFAVEDTSLEDLG